MKNLAINNETLNIINHRCSVRSYLSQKITQKEIDTIIHASMRAPSAGNMMFYSILQVDDQKKKDKLAKTCDNQPFIPKASLVLIFLADMQRWYDYYKVSKVPELCNKLNKDFKTPQESDLMLASCDALIAAQNAVIAAESMGIGSCYIGDIMENIEIHREMFNLPNWVFPITMLCFGYPKSKINPKDRKLTPRFDKKYILFKDNYKRIQDEDFKNMFKDWNISKFIKNATNLGQHFYLKKTGSSFTNEMRRSVKVMIDDWINK